MSTKFELESSDWLIFVSYFIVVSLVAWWFGRRPKSAIKDYFLAGNSLPWFVVGGSMIASSMSTEQLIGNNGAAYKYGFAVAQWDCYVLPPVTMLMWIFLPIYLRRRVVTMPDFLARRYGEGLRDIFSAISVSSYTLLNMAVILYSGVVLLTSLFPFKAVIFGRDCTVFFWSIIVVISTVIYTTWGGLEAVAWTDFVQFFVLCLAAGLVFIFSMRLIGGGPGVASISRGWEVFRESQPERFHFVQPADHVLVPWPALFMRVVTTQLYYNCATQFIVQKALAAKSNWDARAGALLYGVFGLLLPLIDVFPGMIAYLLNPKLEDPNKALPFLIRTVIPIGWGIRGLILAGLIAAVMSALSSLINSTSTIFTLDIYKKWIRPEETEANLLRAARIMCVAITGCAVLWAPLIGRYQLIFVYFQSFLAYIAAPAGAIFLLGVFWRRATHRAAVCAVLLGLPFCLVVEILRKWTPKYQVPFTTVHLGSVSFVYISFAGWLVSMLTILIVSLFDAPPPQQRIEDLIWNRSALDRPQTAGTTTVWYQNLWLWYFLFAAVWVVYITRFW